MSAEAAGRQLLDAGLIHTTGSQVAPAWYLILASIALLLVCCRMKERYRIKPG